MGNCWEPEKPIRKRNKTQGWRETSTLTMAWLNLDSISPSSQSKASPLSRNSSAMRLEQSVDLRWMLKSNVAFSCACRLSGSSPFTMTNFLLNSLTPGAQWGKEIVRAGHSRLSPSSLAWKHQSGTTYPLPLWWGAGQREAEGWCGRFSEHSRSYAGGYRAGPPEGAGIEAGLSTLHCATVGPL